MNKFFKYLKTDSFRKNLIIAIVSMFIFLIAIFFSLEFYTKHGEGLPVPKLKGLPVATAIELLESQGFEYQIDSVYQIDKQPGLVIDQDPEPNTNVKTNRTIYLTIITQQAPFVKLPDIFKMTFLEAQAVLSNNGIKVSDTTYASDVEKDRVLEVSFGGKILRNGEQIPKGSKVSLVLGDGLSAFEVDIPPLVELTLSEASFVLKQSNLNLGLVTSDEFITDSGSAKVIRQMPALSDSLTKVPSGTRIDVVISNK